MILLIIIVIPNTSYYNDVYSLFEENLLNECYTSSYVLLNCSNMVLVDLIFFSLAYYYMNISIIVLNIFSSHV